MMLTTAVSSPLENIARGSDDNAWILKSSVNSAIWSSVMFMEQDSEVTGMLPAPNVSSHIVLA